MPYPPPTNVHVEAIEMSRIVFAWNKASSTQCSSIQYVITTVNCGVCPNTTTNTKITCVQFSISNHTCMFAVQTEICGHLMGPRGNYVIVNLFGEYNVVILCSLSQVLLVFSMLLSGATLERWEHLGIRLAI